MKIITKFILILIVTIFSLTAYLSLVGIETEKLNNQITKKIKQIDKNLDIELNKIKIIFNPLEFRFTVKTIGPKLKNNNKIIEIENIKSQLSLRSLIENKFSIENLEISTKSIKVKNLISFTRSFKNTPELFILEKIIKKGYLIADIKLEFDKEGKIKDNYKISGFIKDTKLSISNEYKIEKIDFIFFYKKDDLILEDINFSLNKLVFSSKKISVKNIKNEFIFDGNINHQKLDFNKDNLKIFVKPFFPKINIKKLQFISKNIFSFKINKKFEFKNFEIVSEMLINELLINNDLDLKKLFPKVKKNIHFSKNKLNIIFKNDDLLINGKGNILLQENKDQITYIIEKKGKIIDFKTTLKVKDNPLMINILDYEKDINSEAIIKLKGIKDKKKQIFIKSLLLNEKKNKIEINDLKFNEQFNIININNINLDYTDKEKQKNSIKFYKKKNEYFLQGPFFNASNLIDRLLISDDNSNILNLDSKVNLDIDKIRLDNEYNLKDFFGVLSFKNKEVVTANLVGNFSNDKKLKFTIDTSDGNKVTTLFSDEAKPFVKRYKFIKGFEEGSLDFSSIKNGNQSNSKLRIYNFKLKELPALTKILTLASLQGIADILSGDGIRFNEFEMNFKNQKEIMTIDEIYAIGPAISILMDGYVEKDRLISLRGTLVPATSINKAISSIPILGKILVGSKTGEGVFGVSFKIKGPPKNTETTVNPIKTLTPRFITRTLEKIKKTN